MMSDLRFAFRQLAKSSGFAAVAILTLALGIGANTALFSIFHRLVLAPLDLPEPDRLVRIWASNPDRNLLAPMMSVPEYELFEEQQQSFAGVAASFVNGFMLTQRDADPEQLPALQVTASWIPTVGLPLLRGRNFTAEDDSPAGARVVILTEGCWRTRFGASETILGESLLLSGTPYTVIGVVREPLPGPIAFVQLLVPRALEGNGLTREQIRSGIGFMQVTARLKPGISYRQADAEVRALSRRYQEAFPTNFDASNRCELRTWIEEIAGNVRPTLIALLAAVALVLLIACANVSNLFLSRLTARQKEIAVRLSLGATRRTLVRQFLLETALFSTIATGLGVLLAAWTLDAVPRLLSDQLPAGAVFTLSGTTLAFTAGVSVFVCAAIGVLPALHASRVNLSDALKDSGRGSSGSRGGRFRSTLVVVEVALSALLLVGSSLLLASFMKLQSAPPGFDPRGAATSAINMPTTRYRTPAEWVAHLDQVLEQLRADPRVQHAAAGSNLPVGFLSAPSRLAYAVKGRPVPSADQRPFAFQIPVTEDYFTTLDVPLRSGRFFTRDDRADAPLVTIVNESFARRLFPNGDALGKEVLRGGNPAFAHQIVGIVADVKSQGLNAPAPDTLYFSERQLPSPFVVLVATVDGDAAALQDIFRSAVTATDRTVAVTLFQTLESALSSTFNSQRVVASLTSVFAGIALLLSALGLYSVLAYAVAQRTNEIGIRMALGASRRQVLALVLNQGMKLVAVGLGGGLAIAAASSQLLQKLLFDMQPLDPRVYAAVAALFAVIALFACWLPARRATKVDPLIALRAE